MYQNSGFTDVARILNSVYYVPIQLAKHWSSPVRKVFSQRGGPVRRSSTVRKLASTAQAMGLVTYASLSREAGVQLIDRNN